jgi:hypothetical protein
MRKNKMILLAMMILPWLSMPFIGKRTFKRFYPGALFICIWVFFENIIAEKKAWWRFYESFGPKLMGIVPLIIGPFFVGSLWILKFTFGNFIRYFIVNFVIDMIFVFPGVFVLKKLGIASLVRLKSYQLLSIFLGKLIIMYGFQSLVNKLRKKPKSILKKLFS